MNPDIMAKYDIDRYRPLGLVANPFALSDMARDFSPIDLEIASHAHRLLGMLAASADEPAAKPIVILKPEEVPQYYTNAAISRVERSLAVDDGLDLVHAYVLMFLLRVGRVRSALQVVAERIAFRDFDTTLRLYVAEVLNEPDESLIAYQMLGEEGLATFRAEFAAGPVQAVEDVFGVAKVERRPELAEVLDARPLDLDSDVEDEDALPEIDGTLGDAPGTEVVLDDEVPDEESADRAVLDYLVEYTKVHLSPVIARALRVYKDRGMAALSTELSITKAPRKTLAALVRFARTRFKKIVLIYDGFDGWSQVPPETRIQIVTTLSELRWMLESDACVVMTLERGGAPELEEQFGSARQLEWDFPAVIELEQSPDTVDVEMIDGWLASASASAQPPLTLGDPVLSALLAGADGSLKAFCLAAGIAIENAAERAAGALDDEALEAGRAASWMEDDVE